MLILLIILLTSAVLKVCSTESHVNIPVTAKFCPESNDIYSIFYPMNEGYDVVIVRNLTAATFITVKLDSIGIVTMNSINKVRFTSEQDLVNNIFSFSLLADQQIFFAFTVKGKDFPHHPPYIVSLKINGEENCRNSNRTYFEKYNYVAKYLSDAPDKFCGRRKVNKESIPLIVSGSTTKAGHWPWHAAINKLTRGILSYICGGTLISKYLVLTAAHCATVPGVKVNPDLLGVVLGKYSLHRIENTNQDREVSEVIVHDEYNKDSVNNDIALLKLSTEAIFNNFVQPACIWFNGIYDHLPSFEIIGTVVGWGIDQSDILSKNLHTATLPIVPDITCIRYEPIYYTGVLNGQKFCAGNSNGTSACNGDSGGGFFVFVEDDRNYQYDKEVPIEERPGAWYVKGIVSATLARKDANICDPNAYTVYTDVAQYRDWIITNMR